MKTMTPNNRLTRNLLLTAMVSSAWLAAGTAQAEPTFFSTSGNILYRFNMTDPPETFALGDSFAAMAVDSNNVIWLIGRDDIDHDGFYEIYSIDDPCGLPTLVERGDFITELVHSMTFIGNTLYVVEAMDSSQQHALAVVDMNAQSVTPVGATGSISGRSESCAFDDATNTLYGINNGPNPVLKIIDWQLLNGSDPTATNIGQTGEASNTAGGDWYNNTYYNLISQYDTNSTLYQIKLGTINITTGAFTTSRIVDSGVANGTIGLCILDLSEGDCPRLGACCLDGVCQLLSQAACQNFEGAYQGDDTNCTDDDDGDGVPNCNDLCPETPAETPVDGDGCSCAQLGDETPPEFVICPQDFDVFPQLCTHILDDYTVNEVPVATDDCASADDITITQVPPAGTELSGGQTLVTLTATDSAGNSSECTFHIQVIVDPCECSETGSVPIIDSCADDVELSLNSDCVAFVPDLTANVVAHDGCTTQPARDDDNANGNTSGGVGLTITQDPAPGTPIGAGDTIVTLTVEDADENTATCQATISVSQGECTGPCGKNDDVPPTIENCPGDLTLQAGADCMATVPDLTGDLGASDNCDQGEVQPTGDLPGLSITQSPEAGTSIGVGETIVTITVTDANNNEATCSVTITVEENNCHCGENDDVAPTIDVCADDTTVLADSNCNAIVPDLTLNVQASDNCTAEAALTITQSPAAGSAIEVGDTTVTITVADEQGNEATCTAVVTVDANGCGEPAPGENPDGNENSNGNDNTNDNTSTEPPGGQPMACDPTTDQSVNVLFSLLFHAPVCGMGCPTMAIVTLCGFIALKSRSKRRRRTRR